MLLGPPPEDPEVCEVARELAQARISPGALSHPYVTPALLFVATVLLWLRHVEALEDWAALAFVGAAVCVLYLCVWLLTCRLRRRVRELATAVPRS